MQTLSAKQEDMVDVNLKPRMRQLEEWYLSVLA
jgi:hypothetical protein